MTDSELKASLREAMLNLDTLSDKRHAKSLANWYGDFSERQRQFANVLIKRAADIRAARGRPRLPDIFQETPTRQEASAPSAPSALDTAQLETIIASVLAPAIEDLLKEMLVRYGGETMQQEDD